MGKVIVVTSGKGGVGKTTSTTALGAALARGGQKLCGRGSDVSRAYLDAARRIKGDRVEMTVPTKNKNRRSLLTKLLGRRAA